MDINDIKRLAVERIYLVPDASDGRLGYCWCDDPAPNEHHDASEAVEYVRKDVHDAIIKRQANSAILGMNAAKEHGSQMEAYAKRLHAESNPEAIESERAANATLTERIAELECQVEEAGRYLRDTSRRDKIKQAEALDNLAGSLTLCFDGNVIDKPSILRRADELRRQAGATNEPST